MYLWTYLEFQFNHFNIVYYAKIHGFRMQTIICISNF